MRLRGLYLERIGEETPTKRECLLTCSTKPTLLLVVVLRIEIDFAPQIEEFKLTLPLKVLGHCFGHGFALCLVTTCFQYIFEQRFIELEICRHVSILTHGCPPQVLWNR